MREWYWSETPEGLFELRWRDRIETTTTSPWPQTLPGAPVTTP